MGEQQSTRGEKAAANDAADVELGGAIPAASLGLWDGVNTIVSLMIGSAIFTAVDTIAEPLKFARAVVLVWVASGVLSLLGALCYAELGTMIPGSGGEAQYLARGMGPLMVFIFNWVSILLLKPSTVAIMAHSTAKYLGPFLPTILGPKSKDVSVFSAPLSLVVPVLFCFITAGLASLSTKWSNRVTGVMTFGKIAALILIICTASYQLFFGSIKFKFIKPAFSAQIKFSNINLSDAGKALSDALFAFDGWNNLNIVAGSLRNPSVNLPLSIWISMAGVVTLYTLTLLSYYAVLPEVVIKGKVDGVVINGKKASSVLGIAFGETILPTWGGPIMSFLISCSTFSSGLSSMVTSSELIVLAAQTKQIPTYFAQVNRRTGTAVRAYMMQAVLSVVFCVFNLDHLFLIYMVLATAFYALCVVVLLILRVRESRLLRPYRVFLTTPVFYLGACALMAVSLCFNYYYYVAGSAVLCVLGVAVFYGARAVWPGAMAIPEDGFTVPAPATPAADAKDQPDAPAASVRRRSIKP